MQNNVIHGINGPVVTVANTKDFSMQEMVYVGQERLVGEVIGINDASTTIQVYEVTTGLQARRAGCADRVAPVGSRSAPASSAIFLTASNARCPCIAEGVGSSFIERGQQPWIDLDTERLWDVTVTVSGRGRAAGRADLRPPAPKPHPSPIDAWCRRECRAR